MHKLLNVKMWETKFAKKRQSPHQDRPVKYYYLSLCETLVVSLRPQRKRLYPVTASSPIFE